MYYQRYVKLMPTTNSKNYPLSQLAFNYTGHNYVPLNFKGTYNNEYANQCVETYSHCLYKYTEKFIQTNNVIIFNDINKYKYAVKYGFTDIKNAVVGNDSINRFVTYVTLKKEEPDPFDLEHIDKENRYDIKTNYANSYKHEIVIGLYKLDSFTNQYDFIHDSFYDRSLQMYYVLLG